MTIRTNLIATEQQQPKGSPEVMWIYFEVLTSLAPKLISEHAQKYRTAFPEICLHASRHKTVRDSQSLFARLLCRDMACLCFWPCLVTTLHSTNSDELRSFFVLIGVHTVFSRDWENCEPDSCLICCLSRYLKQIFFFPWKHWFFCISKSSGC